MIFLNKIGASPICSRLLSISMRNLSISSHPASATNSHQIASPAHNPLLARQQVNVIKDVGITGPLWRRQEILELPLTNKVIETPVRITKVIEEISRVENSVDLPTSTTGTEKQAKNGMIMIRRRKMRKHKLRKLRKKMKFEWAKVRQRREWRKEKIFTTELINQIKSAEKFSAEQYVSDKIRQVTETPLPRLWKNRRLPAFIIKEKVEEEAQKKLKKKLLMWEEYGRQKQ